MNPLPTPDLRNNLGTWAVPVCQLPALAALMRDLLPAESFDPAFRGQRLETTYLDTRHFKLRKARVARGQYLTLRVRCYEGQVYALSAKTEDQKFRAEIEPAIAELVLGSGLPCHSAYDLLPGDLQARLLDLVAEEPLVPVVTIRCRRYAVEDNTDRLTLDCDVATDSGRRLPFGVLELKSTSPDTPPPGSLQPLALRPIKLSKFLWSTEV